MRAADIDSPDASSDKLIAVIQRLSLARDLPTIMEIVRRAARELTGADGATFVLRDGDKCFYAEEDAIEPLWKGRRFPMSVCISGWVMLNRQATVIEDIYADPRIPAEAYRPTFVKSLAMVPIRTEAPLGAIGNYWAARHRPTEAQVKTLAALADTTSVAMENVRVYEELEQRVRDRTRALEAANRELEAFSSAVSHDLRGPLSAIMGFAELLYETHGTRLDPRSREMLAGISTESHRMQGLITSLLALSRTTRSEMRIEPVDLAAMARDIAADLKTSAPRRAADFQIDQPLTAAGDRNMLQILLTNLLSNAWKYSAKKPETHIAVGRRNGDFFVRDNGAGFDMSRADQLFKPFRRLHDEAEFPGMGIGLATVQRIVHRHGGRIWAESAPGEGTTFWFTLNP